MVFDLETQDLKVVADYSDADIGRFQWVNNQRLVFHVRDSTQTSADQEDGPGLYAVDRDGGHTVQLADRRIGRGDPQPWHSLLMLLAYGGEDKRVPIYHGKKFRSAVTRHNEQVEWIVYGDEGHGWSLPKNRIDFWGRVEKFLYKHIGQPRE